MTGVALADVALALPVRLTSPKRSRNICDGASAAAITRQRASESEARVELRLKLDYEVDGEHKFAYSSDTTVR